MTAMSRVLALALPGMLALVASGGAGQEPEVHRITLQARQFEWTPSQVQVKVGETVELTLESLDEEHGFESAQLQIRRVTFKKGEPVKVTFKAEKAGTYGFKCAHFCGVGHRHMRGEIVVVE
jgi:cytochrome c oxidase subunit II